jgi:hypothetical protein
MAAGIGPLIQVDTILHFLCLLVSYGRRQVKALLRPCHCYFITLFYPLVYRTHACSYSTRAPMSALNSIKQSSVRLLAAASGLCTSVE